MAINLFDPEEEQPSYGLLKKAKAKISAGGTLSNNVPAGGTMLPNSMRQRLGKIYSDLDALEAQEPDMSAMQGYAKRQGELGQTSMLNALAAQFAGEQFQPAQEQFLKQAAIAQQPMKIGGGVLTPDGQYVKDPFAQRDARRAALERQALSVEKMITDQERLATARDDKLSQQAFMNGIAAMNAQTARMNAGNVQNNRNFTVEDRMADDFDKAIKNDKIIVNAFENLRNTPASAAGDISFIFQYMKMLDPGSVVREGEFATAQNATGVPEQIQNLYNRALSGQRLNQRQREDFLSTANQLATVAGRRIDNVRSEIVDKAKRRGVSVENIVGGGGQDSDPLGLRRR